VHGDRVNTQERGACTNFGDVQIGTKDHPEFFDARPHAGHPGDHFVIEVESMIGLQDSLYEVDEGEESF
jgi:hypothetical protein